MHTVLSEIMWIIFLLESNWKAFPPLAVLFYFNASSVKEGKDDFIFIFNKGIVNIIIFNWIKIFRYLFISTGFIPSQNSTSFLIAMIMSDVVTTLSPILQLLVEIIKLL